MGGRTDYGAERQLCPTRIIDGDFDMVSLLAVRAKEVHKEVSFFVMGDVFVELEIPSEI